MKYASTLLWLALLLLAVSCHNASTENGEEAQPEGRERSPTAQALTAAFPAAFHFFQSQDPSFDPEKFAETGTDTLRPEPALALSAGLQAYYPYFIYNTDSSYALDLYSYNVLLVKKGGKTIGKAGGPDMEVGLVDLKNHNRRRVYFGGPSSALLDGKWVDRNHFLLLTGEVINGEAFEPTILKYTLPLHTRVHYLYSDTISVRPSEFQDPRLSIY